MLQLRLNGYLSKVTDCWLDDRVWVWAEAFVRFQVLAAAIEVTVFWDIVNSC